MKKLSVATMLALVLVVLLGGTVAYAALHWCPDDPVLSIGGHEVHVEVALYAEQPPEELVKGPMHVKVYVPRNVEAEIIDAGGFKVTIIPNGEPVDGGPIPVTVKARVNTKGPERVTVILTVWEEGGVSTSTEGKSKAWVECEVEL